MSLTLVARNPAHPQSAPIRAAMTGNQLSVGRSSDCDLVLPDPEKFLSKRHCILERRDGDYLLTDTSTNGTFLNFGTEPLDAAPTPMSHGDVILIGQYELVVEIANAPVETGDSAPALGVPGPKVPSGLSPLEEDDEAGDFLNDLLGAPSVTDPSRPAQEPGASVPDHAPATSAYFAPPQTSAPVIPDDWQDSLIALPNAPVPTPAELSPRSVAPPPPVPPVPPAPIQEITPQPEQPPATFMPAPETPTSPQSDALLRAFLTGVGATHLQFSPQEAEDVMLRAGRIMAATVEGLREILMTRAALKSEMRVNRTMIAAEANNPLKFSVSKEQAIEAILKPTLPGYQEPKAAVDEALRDLKAHEIATMTGMEAALKDLLEQLGPDKLAARIEQKTGFTSRFGSKKARYWDAYETHYSEISRATETDFQSTFGREFSRAYEAQIDKL